MNVQVTSVLNPKALEKQLKLYHDRIQSLQDEINELTRLRDACQLLLGTAAPTEGEGASVNAPAAGGKKGAKPALSTKIFELLRDRHEGLTTDAIFEELRGAGVALPEKNADQSIQATLRKHPDLFTLGENERWLGVNAEGPTQENTTQQ